MNDEWQWWALLFGICLGVAGYWLVRERLPRREEDLDAVERAAEAAWISRTVERLGADAPPEVVAAVLELHREYLAERIPARGWVAADRSDTFEEGDVEPAGEPGRGAEPAASTPLEHEGARSTRDRPTSRPDQARVQRSTSSGRSAS